MFFWKRNALLVFDEGAFSFLDSIFSLIIAVLAKKPSRDWRGAVRRCVSNGAGKGPAEPRKAR